MRPTTLYEIESEDSLQDTVDRLVEEFGSLRRLSAITGVPYTTLQNIQSGETQQPTAATLRGIARAFDRAPIVEDERTSSVAVDSAFWTARKLANLVPPPGATDFQIVYKTPTTRSRHASTGWRGLDEHTPADLLLEPGFHPGAVRRVIWGFGGRG